jgi:hypothetical protein
VDGLLSSTRLTRSTRSLDERMVSSIGLVKVRLVLRVVALHRSVRSKYGLATSLIDKEANVSCLFGGKFTTTAHGLFRSGCSHLSREGLVAGSYVNSSTSFCAPGDRVVGASGANVVGVKNRSCRAAADVCVLPSDINSSSPVGSSSGGGVGAVGLLAPLSRTPDESLGCGSFGALVATGGRAVRRELGRTGVQIGDDGECGAPMLHACRAAMMHAHACCVPHAACRYAVCCMACAAPPHGAWYTLHVACSMVHARCALNSTLVFCACCIKGKQMTAMTGACGSPWSSGL